MTTPEIGGDPALVPVLALFQGDETWLVAAGVFDGGITLWCHRPRFRAPRLAAPGFGLSLIDDVGTPYAPTGGGGGMEGKGQEVYGFDFAPRPPAAAARITALGQFDTGLAISVTFALAGSPRVPDDLVTSFGVEENRPRLVIPVRLVVDPDGSHPVHIFGLEAWTRETVLWVRWNSEKGARYVLAAGGVRWPMGNQFTNTPPGVSAARIQLPFVLPANATRLPVSVRLRGRPGAQAEGQLLLEAPIPP